MQGSGDIAEFSRNIEITISWGRGHITNKFWSKLISNVSGQWITDRIMCIENDLASLGMVELNVVELETWWA